MLISRRSALALGAAILAAPVGGCALTRRARRICPTSPGVHHLAGPLTIDAHCHFFNASDLQVADFLSMVQMNQDTPIGRAFRHLKPWLDSLSYTAPSGTEEGAILDEIIMALPKCSDGREFTRLGQLRQDGYTRARSQMRAAVARTPAMTSLRSVTLTALNEDERIRQSAVHIIDGLPDSVRDYDPDDLDNDERLIQRGFSVGGAIAFVIQNFQYRYVTAHDYLRRYNDPGRRVFDLVVPHLVDYDWWLSRGKPTVTSLADQVGLMHQIAVATAGRVHAFVPFDPMRQVAHDSGHDTGSDPLDFVAEAIEKRGCLGVKLYPPMGFAPFGNADLSGTGGGNFWARKWLPDWTNDSQFGGWLDDAMGRLFEWCIDRDVPLMAHSNLSNGVIPEFEGLAGADHWERALCAFPKLRISFGHFGGAPTELETMRRATAFAKLMTPASADAAGQHAFADSGFFVEVIKRRPDLLSAIADLYCKTAGKDDAALSNRFMFGSDWEMVIASGGIGGYFDNFEKLFAELEQVPVVRKTAFGPLADQFFANNAVRWLGLGKGSKTRTRLEKFYGENGVPDPDWMRKVDAIKP